MHTLVGVYYNTQDISSPKIYHRASTSYRRTKDRSIIILESNI